MILDDIIEMKKNKGREEKKRNSYERIRKNKHYVELKMK
ncbi:hypothetical protein BJV89_005124 [Clostridium beijerinckii]|nr:hypothetical protein [Clostridium beijerinckii]